jgi:hypothetical protein
MYSLRQTFSLGLKRRGHKTKQLSLFSEKKDFCYLGKGKETLLLGSGKRSKEKNLRRDRQEFGEENNLFIFHPS